MVPHSARDLLEAFDHPIGGLYVGWCAVALEVTAHDGINGALDYGYAIVRSLVARCIVGVGLHPALGIHHQSRTNPFCLADDLVEPLRPVVDRIVSANRDMFAGDLEPDGKIVLRNLLDLPFGCGEHRGILTTTCERYLESFRSYLIDEGAAIQFPEELDQ